MKKTLAVITVLFACSTSFADQSTKSECILKVRDPKTKKVERVSVESSSAIGCYNAALGYSEKNTMTFEYRYWEKGVLTFESHGYMKDMPLE